MKKILFPTDFSQTASNALEYAHQLAGALGAKVDVINIFPIGLADASSVPPEFLARMLEETEQNAKDQLQSFVASYDGADTQGTTKAIYGMFTTMEIVDYAKENKYDLIIMGTKGEHGAIDRWMGSVCTETMMKSSCPVIAVPEGAHYQPVDQIAYATTFDPSDTHAVEELMKLAGQLEAKVHFVHVDTKKNGKPAQEISSKKYPFTDFAVVKSDTVVEGLDTYMEEHQIKMLSLFIPNRRLWERLFHTSFTRKMTYHSDIPLLVFHA
jgi:nucleotide-binding universal stress UspA family protein